MLPHDGPVNWLLWMRSAFAVTSSDAILMEGGSGFDHSVWECFFRLITGAKLVIAEAGQEADWESYRT